VAHPRPGRGTFLYAGEVPTLGHRTDLVETTEDIGGALGHRLGYRGAFSADGILTSDGFRPTDLNARLTSAIEAAPSALRVRLHATNLLAREGVELDLHAVRRLIDAVFDTKGTYTLYGAATTTAAEATKEIEVRWQDHQLVVADHAPAHGRLTLTPSARGWLLTATLDAAHMPGIEHLGGLAPPIFRLSDQVLGTDFGVLPPPFGIPPQP